MKQIVVISGKGGTGKTFFSGSLAGLAPDRVIADCDVDASNLHFLLSPRKVETHPFQGGVEAHVDPQQCTGCFTCRDVCRFDAVLEQDEIAVIDPILCEGCGVCSHVCPESAITMEPCEAGEWYVSKIEGGTMVHARLKAGEENSGKLVTSVRSKAKEIAEEHENRYVLIDGPPGTGCAVIAALSGVDFAVVITEPTLTGIHDMERVLDLADYFSIKTGVVVNKENLNYKNSSRIREYCEKEGIPVLGSIPYSKNVVESVSKGIPYVDFADDEISDAIKAAWKSIEYRVEN